MPGVTCHSHLSLCFLLQRVMLYQDQIFHAQYIIFQVYQSTQNALLGSSSIAEVVFEAVSWVYSQASVVRHIDALL